MKVDLLKIPLKRLTKEQQFHTEGAGGGHAPDIIKICGEEYIIPSSTNPTMTLYN